MAITIFAYPRFQLRQSSFTASYDPQSPANIHSREAGQQLPQSTPSQREALVALPWHAHHAYLPDCAAVGFSKLSIIKGLIRPTPGSPGSSPVNNRRAGRVGPLGVTVTPPGWEC